MKDCTLTDGWKSAKERSKLTKQKKLQETINTYNNSPTQCKVCKVSLSYKKRLNKFCSSSCAAKLNNVKYPKRAVLNKNILVKKEVVIGTEQSLKVKAEYTIQCLGCKISFVTHTSKRKYCTATCKSSSQKLQNFEMFYDGKTVGHRIARVALIDKFGAKCQLCGWGEKNAKTNSCPIELDHVDGNSKNTVITNVRLLCPNCHSIQPTYKALNKGKGRFSRTQRYRTGKSY